MGDRPFRMGRLDHVHIRVPDRAAAAAWYGRVLGFEPVEQFEFWAEGFEGGPLQLSADGGRTMLALFEATADHPMFDAAPSVAFSVDAETFVAFARALPGEVCDPSGQPLTIEHVVDYDLCWAFDLADPWGNQYELNCYEYELVAAELVGRDAVTPDRKWPAGLHDEWTGGGVGG